MIYFCKDYHSHLGHNKIVRISIKHMHRIDTLFLFFFHEYFRLLFRRVLPRGGHFIYCFYLPLDLFPPQGENSALMDLTVSWISSLFLLARLWLLCPNSSLLLLPAQELKGALLPYPASPP